ncbi:MAG: heavy metal translocating P-type ATPase [Lactimicrobium sp.]|uniref:heavy metal translocating P-type ATPase n=1 Tax=Lactimicrobium sp. TaxID=2563780 RepID=UPI002F355234
MSEHALRTYKLDVTTDCADCAAKVERAVAGIEGLDNVSLSFMSHTLRYDCDPSQQKEMKAKIKDVIMDVEPEAEIRDEEENITRKFAITGIDCQDCADKLEESFRKIEGIQDVKLSFLKESLSYTCRKDDDARIEKEVRSIAASEEPDARIVDQAKEQKKIYVFSITDIDCADCAAKLEKKIAEIDDISDVALDFMNCRLSYSADVKDASRIEREMRAVVARNEPDAKVSVLNEKKEEKAEEEEEEDSRKMLIRLIIGAILFVLSLVTHGAFAVVSGLASYLVLGYDVILKAFRGIGHGQIFDEHFLMTVATFAAIYLRDFKEAAGVMLFYQIGEYFQDMAVDHSRKSIGSLMAIRPDYAMVKQDGEWVKVDPSAVNPGDIVQVKPGEKVPLDGVVVAGAASLNTASLTGESKPVDVDVNDNVLSGSINENGVLEIKVTKAYGDSTVAKILDLVENSDAHKAKAENFITKFSRIYTPAVVLAAVVTAIVVSLMGYGVQEGIYRACTFLVISCPCALVISIPLSFFGGIGGLSSRGVLVKGANLIEALAKTENVVMDKTGTLTSGVFAVEKIVGENPDEILESASAVEYYSNHPIAKGIKAGFKGTISESDLSNVNEIAGRGLAVDYKGYHLLAGNGRLMKDNGIAFEEVNEPGTLVYVAKDGNYLGALVLRDQLKPTARQAVSDLHAMGRKVMIVSGDNQAITDLAGKELGVDAAYGACMPADKVERVQAIHNQGVTAFVGDGVNDAPVLAAADTGIAMGALGSDAAIEAADVVIMDDDPAKVSLAISAARRILRVSNENIVFAIVVKLVCLVLGALGIANMWLAIFADTGVAMLSVLNSLRLLRIARKA